MTRPADLGHPDTFMPPSEWVGDQEARRMARRDAARQLERQARESRGTTGDVTHD